MRHQADRYTEFSVTQLANTIRSNEWIGGGTGEIEAVPQLRRRFRIGQEGVAHRQEQLTEDERLRGRVLLEVCVDMDGFGVSVD